MVFGEADPPLCDVLRRKNFKKSSLLLLAAREKRIRPGRDEKILVSWNALMAKGMARAARVFDKPEWLASVRGGRRRGAGRD